MQANNKQNVASEGMETLIDFALMRPHIVKTAREWVAEGFPSINQDEYSDEEIVTGVNEEFGLRDFLYQYGFVEVDRDGNLYEVATIF